MTLSYLKAFILFFALTLVFRLNAEIEYAIAPQVKIPITITIKNSVDVTKSIISLGDIVECSGYQDICAEFYAVNVIKSPKFAHKTSISLAQIKEIIALEFPNIIASYLGENKVRISRRYSILDVANIKNKFEHYLQEKFYGLSNLKIAVDKVHLRKNIKYAIGSYSIKFKPIVFNFNIKNNYILINNLKNLLLKNNKFEFILVDSSGNKIKHKFKAHIIAKYRIPASNITIRKNKTLSRADYYFKYVNLKWISNKTILNEKKILNKKLKNTKIVNSIFKNSDFKEDFLIKSGEIILLKIKKGTMNIKSYVKALQNGFKGDFILVVYPKNKKKLRVKVMGKGYVEYKI